MLPAQSPVTEKLQQSISGGAAKKLAAGFFSESFQVSSDYNSFVIAATR
jgi:hypothetical protein